MIKIKLLEVDIYIIIKTEKNKKIKNGINANKLNSLWKINEYLHFLKNDQYYSIISRVFI